jgi:RNA recognition motif-containing protein
MNQESTKDVKVHKKWTTFIRSRSPEPFRNPNKKFFIKLRGLPYLSREPEIIEFFRGIRVYKEDICLLFDMDGKFSGEAYVQLHNEPDWQEALTFNLNNIGERYIEIFDTNENEFNKAKTSKKVTLSNHQDCPWAYLCQEKFGIIKLRGLPYSSTESDIRAFFKKLTIVHDGIKRNFVSGRASSECYVVFETKEEASIAMSFNNDKMGSRFIEIFPATIREFHTWMTVNHGEFGHTYTKENYPVIPAEKRRSTIVARGLPYNCQKVDLQKFFHGFRLAESDIHLLAGGGYGKFLGEALVIFEDELEMEKALKAKNLTYLENRYIELTEYR